MRLYPSRAPASFPYPQALTSRDLLIRNSPPPWTPAFVCRSEGRRADDLPAVPFSNRAERLLVRRVHRPFHHVLEQLSGPAGGIQEQHAAYLGAAALPGMRHVS